MDEHPVPGERAGDGADVALPPAEFCRRWFAEDPFGRVVINRSGVIRWANQAAADMVRRPLTDLVGATMADFLAEHELPRALDAIAEIESIVEREAAESTSADAGAPLVFSLRRPDGSTVYAEVGSSAYFGDDLDVLLLRLRPYDSQHDLERFLTGLVASADIEDNLATLVRSVDHLVQDTESAIAYEWDGDSFSAAVTDALPDVLTGVGVPSPGGAPPLPWARCRETGGTVAAAVADLPEPVRTAATERGLVACWALPVTTIPEGTVAASLLVWRRIPFPLQIGHVEGLRRACQAAALAFERRRTERLLVHAATVDQLTGIPNRAQFFEQLEDAVAQAEPGSVAVLYLDLDRFKPVNDTHGHRFGDRLLTQVASLLAANIRPGDFVARLGGDEFAVLCRDIGDWREATAVADRLVEVVDTPIILDGTRVRIGVSIGVALAKVHGHTHDAVLDAADHALYDAKRAGRGRWKLAAVS